MNRIYLSSRLSALALTIGYLGTATAAGAQATATPPPSGTTEGTEAQPESRRSVTYIDLTAGGGYASNPFLRTPARSAAFGRVSLAARQAWNDERGTVALSGFVEDTTYLRGGYGSKVIFRLGARADRAVSETVRMFGNVSLSGDLAGQLSNRFTDPVIAPPPDVTPPNTIVPDVINLSGRQYRLSGQLGASITTGALSSVNLSAGASHVFFTGQNKPADYTSYFGSAGYSRQVSERTSIGAAVNLQREDFRGDNYSNIVNPVATIRTQLSQDISANGSIGIMAIYTHQAGQSDHSYSPSFTGSICKSGEKDQWCANASRTAQTPLSFGTVTTDRSAAITTNLGLSYNRRLGERETIRALVTATRSSSVRINNQRFRDTYVTGLVGYDRKVGNRLYAGAQAGARKLFQDGPDPRMDFNASLYLRYRLGDLI